VSTMLELDLHSHVELLDVEGRRRPVNADLVGEATSFVGAYTVPPLVGFGARYVDQSYRSSRLGGGLTRTHGWDR
jgi:hypothetical protein